MQRHCAGGSVLLQVLRSKPRSSESQCLPKPHLRACLSPFPSEPGRCRACPFLTTAMRTTSRRARSTCNGQAQPKIGKTHRTALLSISHILTTQPQGSTDQHAGPERLKIWTTPPRPSGHWETTRTMQRGRITFRGTKQVESGALPGTARTIRLFELLKGKINQSIGCTRNSTFAANSVGAGLSQETVEGRARVLPRFLESKASTHFTHYISVTTQVH